jgi:hypothetical protein
MKTAFAACEKIELETGRPHDVIVRPDGFLVSDRNPPEKPQMQMNIYSLTDRNKRYNNSKPKGDM